MDNRDFVDKVRRSKLAMRPVLPPRQQLELGAIGVIDGDGAFRYRGTVGAILGLNNLGGTLPDSVDAGYVMSATSGRQVKVGINAGADVSGEFAKFANIRAKASLSFGSDNSFFLALQGLTVKGLAEPQLIILAMLQAYANSRWDRDWVFIYQLGIAHHLTLVLADAKDTRVMLSGSGKAALGAAADVDLAVGFRFAMASQAVEQLVGAHKQIAFYNAYGVHDPALGKPKVRQALAVLQDQPFGAQLDELRDVVELPIQGLLVKK